MRDAVAAARNLEALLRRPRVPMKTIVEVLPELREGVRILAETFAAASERDAPAALVGQHGSERTARISEALDEVQRAKANRWGLARRVAEEAQAIEACADMLALLDRAAAPAPTEVGIARIVREVRRISGRHGREVVVRFDEADPDCAVASDPYVLGPLVSLLAARGDAEGESIVVRTRCTHAEARIVVEPTGRGDARLPKITLRVVPWLPPSEAVARSVAERIGGKLELSSQRAELAFPIAPG